MRERGEREQMCFHCVSIVAILTVEAGGSTCRRSRSKGKVFLVSNLAIGQQVAALGFN